MEITKEINMENFTFCSPTEFIFGRDTQKKTGDALKRYGAAKVMIVYGSERIRETGLLPEIEDSLREAGIEFCEFGGIAPNPTASSVYAGIAKAVEEGVNFLLAVGGGSPIDAAKGIALEVLDYRGFLEFL